MRALLPALLRSFFPGRHASFCFRRPAEGQVQRPDVPLNLYVHVPFCRHLCAFCPYVKQVYDQSTAAAYGTAVLRELEAYREAWGRIDVASVYFGGGTPSMTPEIVETVLTWLDRHWGGCREVGVEIHPLDALSDTPARLRHCGVTLVSLGVQTFDDRLLALLDRGYDGAAARTACTQVINGGFDSVDIDLMFALPSQAVEDAKRDFSTAVEVGADQISTYPLIQFWDTPLAAQLMANGVRLTSSQTERRMLTALVRQARAAAYERSSIWSFNKPGAPRYTTVTRDSFLGIGAGASSRMGDQFRVNTFSVSDYIEATRKGSPVALSTHMDEGDRMAYWLFWRYYDTSIDTARFTALFGRDVPLGVWSAVQLLRLAGLMRQREDILQLTDSGAYLFHLVEKQYTHSYLERLWAACRKEAWPDSVRL